MSVELLPSRPIDVPDAVVRISPVASISPLTIRDECGIAEDWRMLFDRDEDAYALQHPAYVEAEVRHLAKSRLEPLSISVRRCGELAGLGILLPKSISTRKAGGVGVAWTLHGYRLAGSRFLKDGDDVDFENRLLGAALEAVAARGADFLLIEDLDQASSLWGSVGCALPAGWKAFAPFGYQARLRIRFPEKRAEYWQQFSGKTRSTFRRKLKKFGSVRLERVTRSEQVEAFLETAHHISVQTWQTRRLGLRIRNDEAERQTLSALADAGLLRSYVWYSNDEPAAFCVGNQAHGVFHYEEVGYATKFARFSPGQMLVVQMIDDLLSEDSPTWFDFGGGDAEYKRMFANHESISGTVWLTPPSLKSRVTTAWLGACCGLRQAVRQTASMLGLSTRARQWIRYGRARSGGTEPTASDEETPS